MTMPLSLVWELLARDGASVPILRVAGAADKGSASMARMSKTMVGLNAKMAATGAALTKGVTVPLLGIGAVATAQAIKYQRAMTMVQTSTNTSAAEVNKASKALLQLAGKVGQAPEALSVSFYHAKSTGLAYAKALGVVKLAAEGAAVGHTDLEATTNSLTAAVVSGIPGVKNFSQAMGALNAIVGQGDMKWSDLNEALSNGILKVGKEYGLSIRDVGAALADFGDNNIRGANAATQLRMAIMGLSVPAKAGSKLLGELGLSSEGSAKALAKIHLQTGTLAKDLQTGGLLKAVGDLRQHLVTSGIPLKAWGTALTQAFGKKAGVGIQIMVDDFGRLQQKFGLIGKQAGGFGKAFAETSKTAGFKADQLKAKFQALSIELGTHLLPVFEKIVNGLSSAVHWFDSLSGTQTSILGWSTGILFAMGPVLLIGSKLALLGRGLGRFVTSTTMAFATVRGVTEASAARIAVAAGRVTAALGGAGIGLAIGQLTKSSSGAVQAFGALSSAAAGAAIGFGAGGPVGAAIGGFAGLLADVGTLLLGSGDDAKQAQAAYEAAFQAAKQKASEFADVLRTSNGLINQSVKLTAIKQLTDSGALQRFSGLGFDPKQVVNASLGSASALKGVTAELNHLYKIGLIDSRTFDDLAGALNATSSAAAEGQQTNILTNQALGKSIELHRSLTKEVKLYGHGLADMTGEVKFNAGAVLQNTAAGEANTEWLKAQIQKAKDAATASLKHGHSVEYVATVYNRQIGALQRSVVQAHFNKDAVQGLIDKYGKLPKNVSTRLHMNRAEATSEIVRLQRKIDAIRQGKVPHLTASNAPGRARIAELQRKIDALKQRYAPKLNLNNNPALSSLREVQSALDNLFSRALNPPTVRLPVSLGPASTSIPNRPALIGAGSTGKVHPASGGYVTGPGTGRSDSIPAMISNGEYVMNARSTAKFLPTLHAMNRAKFADGGLAGSVVGSLKSFLSPNNLSNVQTSYGQFTNLLSAVRADHGSSALISRLKAEDAALNDAIRKRMADAGRLAKAQQILNDVATATKQGFDITSAGADDNGKVTFGSLRASQLQQKNIIQRWASGLRKIAKIFGKSPAGKAMLLQLAQAGPSSFPQVDALAHAGPSALKSIVSTQQSINATAGSIGGFISSVETGGTIAQHKRQLRIDDRHDERLAAHLAHSIHHSLAGMTWKLSIDARGVAKITLAGTNQLARRT